MAIKGSFVTYEHANSDELAYRFLNKNISDFCKTWNKRVGRNLASHTTTDGHSDDGEIAQVFADKFWLVLVALHRNMLMNFTRY